MGDTLAIILLILALAVALGLLAFIYIEDHLVRKKERQAQVTAEQLYEALEDIAVGTSPAVQDLRKRRTG